MFQVKENTGLFRAKKLMETWYLLITEKFLFWGSCFGDGIYGLIFSQETEGKMIFTWSFWAFHDIPGLRKYGFLYSEMVGVSGIWTHDHWFCPDALIDWVIRPWVQLALRANFVEPLQFHRLCQVSFLLLPLSVAM